MTTSPTWPGSPPPAGTSTPPWPPGPPAPPPDRPKRRPWLWLGVVGGLAGLAAVALAVWIFISGAGADSDGRAVVNDITEEPTELWTYAAVERGAGASSWYFEMSGLDDDTVLVRRDLSGDADRSQSSRSQGSLPGIAAVDVATGEERWFVDAPALGAGPDDTLAVHGATPEGHLVLAVEDWARGSVRLAALEPATGEIVGETERDGQLVQVSVRRGGAAAPVLLSDGVDLMRLSSADLDGPPEWTAPFGVPYWADLHDGYLMGAGDEQGSFVLDVDTGTEPPWSEPGDFSYQLVGDEILRIESTESGFVYADMLDESGEVLWSRDADTILTPGGSGGTIVLAGESYGEESLYWRLDPRTGEEMWDEPYESSGDWFVGTVSGALVVTDYSRATLVDLADGTLGKRLRVGNPRLGTEVVYEIDHEAGRMRALSVADGSDLWSIRLADGTTVHTIDGDFYTLDDRGQVSRLG